MAGVQASADQLVGRSVDGFTAGMPVEWVMDESRVPMIAVGMNDEPLPRAHGYPARLIIPGLYGYVSATKWLSELELTRFDQFEGFWIPRGWAGEGPDPDPVAHRRAAPGRQRRRRPRAGRRRRAGRRTAASARSRSASTAAPGPPAKLSTPIAKATWVQWRYDWDATSGSHSIAVRATDGTGEVQTDSHSAPAPDGARGHHTIAVSVG